MDKRKRYVCHHLHCNFWTEKFVYLIRHLVCHRGLRGFECLICGCTFARSSALSNHLQTHETDLDIKCGFCKQKFISEADLIFHMLKHTNGKSFACYVRVPRVKNACLDADNKRFYISGSPKKSLCELRSVNMKLKCKKNLNTIQSSSLSDDSKKYKCMGCNYLTNKSHSLVNHLMTHIYKDPYSCNDCDFTSLKSKLFNHHLMRHFTPSEKSKKYHKFSNNNVDDTNLISDIYNLEYVCTVCDENFYTEGSFSNHMAVHSKEKTFSCSLCDHKEYDRKTLKYHMISHSNISSFVCRVCGDRFHNRSELQIHSNIHNIFSSEEANNTQNKQSDEVPKKPSASKFFFVDSSNYSVHEDPDSSNTGNTHCQELELNEKPFNCPLLPSPNIPADQAGISCNMKPFKCDECLYRCSESSSLREHIYKNHRSEGEFPCDECDLKFNRLIDMEIHHKTSHNADNLFECSFCGFKAKRQSTLLSHISIHSSDKPFQCNLCNYSAHREEHLTAHMKKHYGERPYECEYCNFKTSLMWSLKQHMAAKHSGSNSFTCQMCCYVATSKTEFTSHEKTHKTLLSMSKT